MMKKITLLCLLVVSFTYAQEFPLDFSDPLDLFVGSGATVAALDVDPDNAANAVLRIDGGAGQFDDPAELVLARYVDVSNSANNTITIDFYASAAGIPVLFQLGNEENAGFPVEMQFTSTMAGWDTYTLDFDSADNGFPWCQTCPDPQAVNLGSYAKVAVFVDFGTMDENTHYVDDIDGAADGGPVASAPTLPIDFESSVPITSFDGGTLTIVPNPQVDGDNGSAMVAEMVKNGGQVWGGAFIQLDAHLDFSSGTAEITMKVRSNQSREVRVQMEQDNDFNVNYGVTLNTDATADNWETLTYDFSGAQAMTTLSKFVLVLEPTLVGDGTADFTIQVDDPTFNETSLGVENFNIVKYSVYPNPTQTNWNIKATGQPITSLVVYDMLGKKVINMKPETEEVTLDATQLLSGLYFVQLTTPLGTSSIKLIKK